MKIVILNGSPRIGGNTDELVTAFKNGASISNDVEVINVCEKNINPCRGCNACLNSKQCYQKDDMLSVYEALSNADALVVASPVYFYGISSQLKAVIDRLHNPIRNDFKISRLGLMLVGAASRPDLFDAVKLQYEMLLQFFNLESIGELCVPSVKDKGDVKKTTAVLKAYEWGKSLKI